MLRGVLATFGLCLLMTASALSLARRDDIEGAWLVFISEENGDSQLHRMWSDGRLRQQITHIKGGWRQNPAPAPSGNALAFVSWHEDDAPSIYLWDFEAGTIRRLNEDDAWQLDPAWSPDGKALVYLTQNPDEQLIWHDLASGNERTIPSNYGRMADFAFAPDGESLWFHASARESIEIFRLTLADNEIERVTFGSHNNEGYPAVSPDGSTLAFISGGDSLGIYTMPTEGGRWGRVTPRRDGVQYSAPEWSPDGQWLAYWGMKTGHQAIYISRPDGRDLRQFPGPGQDVAPVWMPQREMGLARFEVALGAVALILMSWGFRRR